MKRLGQRRRVRQSAREIEQARERIGWRRKAGRTVMLMVMMTMMMTIMRLTARFRQPQSSALSDPTQVGTQAPQPLPLTARIATAPISVANGNRIISLFFTTDHNSHTRPFPYPNQFGKPMYTHRAAQHSTCQVSRARFRHRLPPTTRPKFPHHFLLKRDATTSCGIRLARVRTTRVVMQHRMAHTLPSRQLSPVLGIDIDPPDRIGGDSGNAASVRDARLVYILGGRAGGSRPIALPSTRMVQRPPRSWWPLGRRRSWRFRVGTTIIGWPLLGAPGWPLSVAARSPGAFRQTRPRAFSLSIPTRGTPPRV